MATNENGTSKDLSSISKLSIIREYEKVPVVSLEEATAALVSIVPEVEKMVMTVKRVRNISTDDLTNDESASISLYTLYWEPKNKSFAVFLDTALQTTNTNVLKPWLLYLKLIMTAFAKLPLVVSHTTIYRAIKLNLIAQYPSKEIFIWWSFTKCTTNIDEFNKDHILGHSGPRTLFIIDCRSSKNIRQHSFYSRDDVLLPFGCQYQVLGCFNSGNGLSIVHIKEISSTYQSSNTTPLLPSIPLNPKPKLIVPTSATILPAIQTSERRMSKILSKKPLITQRPLKRPIELVTIQPRRSLPTSINTKFKEIIESLNSGSQLINLDLSRSQITDAEIKILAEKLQQNKTVTTLNLHHNFIGPQGAHDLANVLKENTTLRNINLECNDISDQGMQYLGNALSQNKTLTTLNLRSNQIRPQGIEYLAIALQENTTLRNVKLRSNFIGNLGARYLATALKQNKTLTTLDLGSNQIGPQGAQYLIRALDQNNTLTLLNFERNQLDGDVKQRLTEISQKNSTFKFLV